MPLIQRGCMHEANGKSDQSSCMHVVTSHHLPLLHGSCYILKKWTTYAQDLNYYEPSIITA